MSLEMYTNIKQKKFGPFFVVVYLLIIGSLEYSIRNLFTEIDFSLLLMYEDILLISLFFFISMIFYIITVPDEKITVIVKKISSYFWMIALSPILTQVLGGECRTTLFLNFNLLSKSITFQSKANIGVTVLLFIMPALLSLLILLNQKKDIDIQNKILSPVISFFGVFITGVLIFFVRRVLLIYQQSFKYRLYDMYITSSISNDMLEYIEIEAWSGMLINQGHLLSISLLIIEAILLITLLFYLADKKGFFSYINNIKPFRTLHFVVLVVIGVLVVQKIKPKYALEPLSPVHFPYVFFAALCLALLWQFTSMLNDLFDINIDGVSHPDRPLITGSINKKYYTDMCMLIPIISSLLSFLLGFQIFLLNLAAVFLAVVYSVPPVRLRNRFYGHICVGLGSVIAFLFGVYSPIYWKMEVFLNSEKYYRAIPFYPDVLKISLIILVVLSISPLINAIGDFKGDKKQGVKNLYTVFGYYDGKRIVTVLILLMFLTPLLIIYKTIDFAVIVPVSVIASYIFFKYTEYKLIFVMYFAVLFYTIMRFLSIF